MVANACCRLFRPTLFWCFWLIDGSSAEKLGAYRSKIVVLVSKADIKVSDKPCGNQSIIRAAICLSSLATAYRDASSNDIPAAILPTRVATAGAPPWVAIHWLVRQAALA